MFLVTVPSVNFKYATKNLLTWKIQNIIMDLKRKHLYGADVDAYVFTGRTPVNIY